MAAFAVNDFVNRKAVGGGLVVTHKNLFFFLVSVEKSEQTCPARKGSNRGHGNP
jgi:hypothetical protein